MTIHVIMVGTGGWGKSWCRHTLPRAVREGLVRVVAAVDVNPESLAFAAEHLGLTPEQCFTEAEAAFASVRADACIIAVPPAVHERIARLALRSGCDVLSEKPISDTLEASLRIVQAVKESGRKMGVTMTHRYRQPIWTLRDLMASGRYGKLDYIVFNFTWNRRDGLNARQAAMDNTMLIEGAVHHLDMLENMAGARCESLYADAWTPRWGNFTGSAEALMTLRFANDVRVSHETSWCTASSQNSWEQEYIRAEFEHATLVLNRGNIECFAVSMNGKGERNGVHVPLKQQEKWGNDYLLHSFVNWVRGGEAMETHVEANLRSMLLVHSAIESAGTRLPIDVRKLAEQYGID